MSGLIPEVHCYVQHLGFAHCSRRNLGRREGGPAHVNRNTILSSLLKVIYMGSKCTRKTE